MANDVAAVPPTPAQRRWWVLSQLEPRDLALVVTHLVPLPGPTGAAELRSALDVLAADIPALRRGFEGGGTGRLVDKGRTLASIREAAARDSAEWRAVAEAEARDGFDLVSGPLLRAVVGPTALLLVGHRALGDGAFLDRVARALLAVVRGEPAPAQVVDPAADRAWLAGADGRAAIASERERLRGASLTLDLATDRVRTDQRSHVAAAIGFELSPAELEALDALAQGAGRGRPDALAAVYALLLSRHARQAELLLGEHVESAAGGATHPLNAVVVRVDTTSPLDARELVTRVGRARDAARAGARVPFEAVLEDLAPARDPSRAPVFQAALRLRRLDGDGLDEPVVGIEVDLLLEADDSGGRLRGRLCYATELFEPATAARILGHLRTLLVRLARAAGEPVQSVSMLTETERQLLLEEWSPEQGFRGGPPIHRWVEAQAARRPEAEAVRCGDTTATYGELNRRANRLARLLRAKGVGRDSRVLVCMDRSVELVVVLLGILKAGGAYVPIEPTNPPERVSFVLADARAALAVADRSVAERLHGSEAEILFAGSWDEGVGPEDDDLQDPEPPQGPTEDSLAYVIYTSGSTGKPKGCLVSHRNVARLFEATQEWFHFDEHDVWTMFHSVAFDFSVWEIWGALVYGGRLVVVPQAVTRSPEDFVRLCAAEHVTVLNQTPSAFRQFIAAEARVAHGGLSLREVVFGGEALELQSLRPWYDRHGDQKPRLVNMYGITETTVHVTYRPLSLADLERGASSVIGRPIPDLYVYLLDENALPVPVGVPGEIHVGGAGVARGYLDRPELTAQRFVLDPFRQGRRLYRSGDLARWLPDGDLDYLGRIDQQVKIRGFRVETGEIEAVLRRSGKVSDVAVLARPVRGETVLVAYVVGDDAFAELRALLRQELPEYMVPAAFVRLDAIPMTGNGKVDRALLPPPSEERAEQGRLLAPESELERTLCRVWCEVLGLAQVGVDESFFDLGGNSLRVVAVATRLREQHGLEVAVAKLFHHSTIRGLAAELAGTGGRPGWRAALERRRAPGGPEDPVAIVGMAGRFPGAADVDSFWKNLCDGVEGLTVFAPSELDPAVPAADRDDPAYVAARPVLTDAEDFDAAFFGIPPTEADVTDPQQRVMLEVAWSALENAGYDPAGFPGLIGVYCGEYNVSYYTANVLTRPDVLARAGAFLAMVGNEKDFIATRVAHRLDLKGPAISVHTACSTSLVAVVQAFHALRTYQCDMALAGGSAISFPQAQGHLYSEGGMLSADGHTRPFDARATGTTFGDGAAMVVLKRLSDARAAGDHVYAVIRGAAVNNDGGHRMSFSAPTVEGQAQVIALAHAVAGVSPETIQYVEGHGTATPLGDPIEVEALTQAFRAGTDRVAFCGLGSVKSNVGHLVAAAGVTGLIKTALALERELIPRTLHFESPNPRIAFAGGPFFVVDENRPWPRGEQPRRAGVSSFGVGGTNAHVVLEETPAPAAASASRPAELLLLSARAPASLTRMAAQLANHLERDPGLPLSDAAFTLALGRRAFAQRCAVVARDAAEAARLLTGAAPGLLGGVAGREHRELVFLFPGQGAQHVGMGRQLHRQEPVFRAAFDRCADAAASSIGCDLREILFAAADEDEAAAGLLRDTRLAQPALFSVSYALAALLGSWGLRPDLMIGHSVGEFVAACLASVMSVEDAVCLVAERGRLMQSMPRGGMLSVRAAADQIAPKLGPALSIAAVNSPKLCVVAGPDEAVDAFARELEAQGVAASRLHTSHAFHSSMMDPAIAPFEQCVRRIRLSPPRAPIISTVTGRLLTDAEAVDPSYWARHLRATVRFADAVAEAWKEPSRVLVDVGPRGTNAQLARQSASDLTAQVVVPVLDGKTGTGEWSSLLRAAGLLFCHGLSLDLEALFKGEGRRRLPLPAYSFERTRHFVEPGTPLWEGSASPAVAPQAVAPGAAAAWPQAVVSGPAALVQRQLQIIARQVELLSRGGGRSPKV